MNAAGLTSNSIVLFAAACSFQVAGAAEPPVAFKTSDQDGDSLQITIGGEPFADYVYRDEQILRPYFAHVRAPGGVQVTRNHPPRPNDTADHAAMHPGIWLAFGDIGGADFWRNKGRVAHQRFVQRPRGGAGKGSFAVENRYLAPGSENVICTEVCRYTVLVRPAGYLLISDSTFANDAGDFYFGDQEEMGLGVRVATSLAVNQGGRIVNSAGQVNEKQVWGQQADWCGYSGVIDGQRIGLTIMPDPKNFRPSWFHARDYGLLVANPFGQNAFTRGAKSKVTVKRGQSLRLRFGVLAHASEEAQSFDATAAYRDFLRQIDGEQTGK